MLHDQTNKAIQALSNLGCATEHWDDWLVFLVSQKLDKSSRKAWELKLGDTVDYPRYREFDQFLASRIRAFDAIAPVNATEKAQTTSKKKTLALHIASTVLFSCSLCKVNHLLYQCSTFLKQTPSQRFEFIKNQKRCVNCTKHSVKDCKNLRDNVVNGITRYCISIIPFSLSTLSYRLYQRVARVFPPSLRIYCRKP